MSRAASPTFERVRPSTLRVDRRFAKLLSEPKNLAGIRESIIREGAVLVPLLVTRGNLVLDGHHRLKIALEIGLKMVPVIRIDVDGASTWAKAVAIVSNLHRRHIGEAQRVALGTSLERIERVRAKERQRAAGGVRRDGTASPHCEGNRAASRDHHAGETTTRVAAQVGVSRLTYERARAVLASDAALARRMLAGQLSVFDAYAHLRRREIAASTAAESSTHQPGLYRGQLARVPGGLYRTILADPPWGREDDGTLRSPANHYPTMPLAEIAALNVARLAHPAGSHLWLWTTWPMLRDGAPQRVLAAWGFRWTSELVWVKHRASHGRWLRPRSEVCILAVRGKLPLLSDYEEGVLDARRRRHSEKPREVYPLDRTLQPGAPDRAVRESGSLWMGCLGKPGTAS